MVVSRAEMRKDGWTQVIAFEGDFQVSLLKRNTLLQL